MYIIVMCYYNFFCGLLRDALSSGTKSAVSKLNETEKIMFSFSFGKKKTKENHIILQYFIIE